MFLKKNIPKYRYIMYIPKNQREMKERIIIYDHAKLGEGNKELSYIFINAFSDGFSIFI